MRKERSSGAAVVVNTRVNTRARHSDYDREYVVLQQIFQIRTNVILLVFLGTISSI